MKVIINEQESYDIKIPDQCDAVELEGIISRLSKISKLASKDVLAPDVEQGQRGSNPMPKSRWKTMSKQQMANFCKKYFEATDAESRAAAMKQMGFVKKAQAYNFIDNVAKGKFGLTAKNFTEFL